MTTGNVLFVAGKECLCYLRLGKHSDQSWLVLEQNIRWYKNSLFMQPSQNYLQNFSLSSTPPTSSNFLFFNAAPPNTKFSPNTQFMFPIVSLPIISLSSLSNSSLPNSSLCLQAIITRRTSGIFFLGIYNAGVPKFRARGDTGDQILAPHNFRSSV